MTFKVEGHPGLYRRSEGGPIWVKYYAFGKMFRESSGGTDITKAERLLRRRRVEVEDGKQPVTAKQKRATLGQLVASLITWYENHRE